VRRFYHGVNRMIGRRKSIDISPGISIFDSGNAPQRTSDRR